jgi:hypothetical protein
MLGLLQHNKQLDWLSGKSFCAVLRLSILTLLCTVCAGSDMAVHGCVGLSSAVVHTNFNVVFVMQGKRGMHISLCSEMPWMLQPSACRYPASKSSL